MGTASSVKSTLAITRLASATWVGGGATIGVIEIPSEEAHRFGVLLTLSVAIGRRRHTRTDRTGLASA